MKFRDESRRINLYLTQKCNMNCGYCVIHSNEEPFEPFDYDGYKTLIKDFRQYADELITIHIYGGEPLIHPDIKEIVDFFNSLPFVDVLVLTNGELIHKFEDLNCEFIVTYHPANIKFYDFVKNLKSFKYQDKIFSISYMYNGDDLENSVQEFKTLKNLFDIEIVFWPIINPAGGESKSLNVDKNTELMLIEDDQNFFRLNVEGTSTYHVWQNLGLFVDKKEAEKYFDRKLTSCDFFGTNLLEVYNNRIFRCSAELQLTIGPNNYKDAYKLTEYNKLMTKLKSKCFECTQPTCVSFDYDYMIGNK